MKKRFGNTLIVVLLLITLMLWLASKSSSFVIEPLKFVSQISSLIGTTLFAISFLLATRFRILEKLFGGLDKVYQVHHLVGVWAYTLLLIHPILLLINSNNIALVQIYLLPSDNIPYTLGVLSLYLLSLHIITTIYLKLPYHIWKNIHILIGFPLLIGLLHSLTIVSDVSRYLPLRLWILFLFLIAFIAYIYKEFLYGYFGQKSTFKVLSKDIQGDIVKLRLQPLKKLFKYKPGQFVFLSFPKTKLGTESHPFSITTIPNQEFIEVRIKKLGDYTSGVFNVQIDDIAVVHGPYGIFGESVIVDQKVQLIAAGIGITPFISIIRSMFKNEGIANASLLYIVKNRNEIFFSEELEDFRERGFKVDYYISEEMGPFKYSEYTNGASNDKNMKVYMCAPKRLMQGIEKDLIASGVKERNIIYEQFDIK